MEQSVALSENESDSGRLLTPRYNDENTCFHVAGPTVSDLTT